MENATGSIDGEKTSVNHWNGAWASSPRMRLPSGLNVSTLNLQRLLKRYVYPGAQFLEIGFAPGKILAWTGKVLGAQVAGLDYSPPGCEWARKLFWKLGISGDLRCENAFATSFERDKFDIVFSAGVIEHFDDPKGIVDVHVRLVKPGGRAIMAVPNFAGLRGRLLKLIDPASVPLHNLSIMSRDNLMGLVPKDMKLTARAYVTGRLSLWHYGVGKLRRKGAAKAFLWGVNLVGVMQPCDLTVLCPLMVLEIVKD